MNLKSIIHTILFSVLLLPCTMLIGVVNVPEIPQLPDFQLSDEDMNMIAELMSNLSDKELEELAKIGESIVEEAKEKGVDPFAYAHYLDTMYAQEQQDAYAKMAAQPKPLEVKQPEKPAVPDTSKISSLQETIQDIIRSIQDIRQKATHNEEFGQQLVPLKYRLDDIVYYLHALLHEKILAHIAKPEFEAFVAQLHTIQEKLASLVKRLEIPEFSLEGYDAYHVLGVNRTAAQAEIVNSFQKKIAAVDPNIIAAYQAGSDIDEEDEAYQQFKDLLQAYTQIQTYEEARHIFDEILRILMNTTPQLLETMKDIFKKYEPETLKIQQEREKNEQEARKRQEESLRKMPLPGRYLSEFTMPPASYYKGSLASPSAYGTVPSYSYPGSSSFPSYAPSSVSSGGKFGGSGATKPATKDKKEETKKKKKEDKKDKKKEKAEDKKGGAPAKKAPADEVQQRINYAKYKFDQLKDLFKKDENKAVLKDMLVYFTKPFIAGEQRQLDVKRTKDIANITSAAATIFLELTNIITDGLKKFKDDETKQKQFKDAIQEEFNKIESTPIAPEFALLRPLLAFKGDAKVITPEGEKPFNPEKLFVLTGKKEVIERARLSEAVRKELLTINPEQPVEVEDPTPEDPQHKKTELQSRNYMQKLQDAYKGAKDALKPAETKKPGAR